MTTTLSQPPLIAPVTDSSGVVTRPWNQWFSKVQQAISNGGNVTPTEDAMVLSAFPDSISTSDDDQAVLEAWNPESQADPSYGLWDDLRMGSSARLQGTNDPVLTVFLGSLRAWAFVDGAATKELFLQGQLPHGYKEGSDISIHVHWGHISATDNGAVVWQCEYAWTNIGEAMPTPLTAVATASNVLGAERYFQKLTKLVTLPGAGKKISSILTLRIFRDPTNTGDTSTAAAYLFEVDAHFQRDHNGSVGEASKY